jgi:c-di-GMP-binding flagellar brake protein YcgR
MDERRKSPRRSLYRYLEVVDSKSKRLVGRLVNLTPEGMMLMSEKPIKEQGTRKLKVSLPESVLNLKTITVDTECRWCATSVNPDYYDAGFEFTKIPEQSAEAIDYLLKFQAFNS